MLLPMTLLCLLIAYLCLADLARERLAPRLRAPTATVQYGPHISVLIPARNEAAGIGQTLAGLAAQTYPAFDVLVVDDDSSDGTAEVARRFGGSLSALDVLAGMPLPAGWAGKCWACWQASERSRGEWLLFLDADVVPQPGLLAALLERATAVGADLVTLMPLVRLGSWPEKLALPAFGSILYGLYPPALVSNPASGVGFANGQCIFVRRAAYEAAGGHRAVRHSVLEDVELGRSVRAAGYRLHAALAPDLLEVRMYTGWSSVVEGLGKNAIAGYRSGGRRSAWVGARQALIGFAPPALTLAAVALGVLQGWSPLAVALLVHGVAVWLLAAALYGWLMHRRYRIGVAWGMGYPLGLAIYYGLALRSYLLVAGGRGVAWKGRTLAG